MRLIAVLLLLILSPVILFSVSVHAQSDGLLPGEELTTNPKVREQLVTATVPDFFSPSTPILVSPEDESTLTTSTPTFEWQAATDNVGVSHYQFWFDGSLLFDSIPTTATSNSSYTLLYDSQTNHFFLTPKTPLTDGNHTWQVRAFDAAGNSSVSVIWDFSIDTTAPSFEITNIGPNEVTYSTGDANSVPDDPLHLSNNEPLFQGTGEQGASVQVTITIPGDPTQNHTFSIDSNGNWQFQVGILPRNTVIELDFVITDSFGNISIISDVKIVIDQLVIVYPPPSPSPTSFILPSPLVDSSPLPSGSPTASSGATPTPTPSPSPAASPLISIPITPPRELIHEVIQEATELIPPSISASLPGKLVAQLTQSLALIAPIGAAIVSTAVPLLALLSLLLEFGGNLSLQLFIRFLQAVGLLPVKEPQGIVFNSATNQPIPCALLTIQSTDPENTLFETVVTDENGIYQGIQLPHGTYTITVTHQDYTFPTTEKRPNYLTVSDFYKGEQFKIASDTTHQLFLIPVDPKEDVTQRKTIKSRIRLAAARIRMKKVLLPMFLLSLFFTLLSPSKLNYFILFLYVLAFTKKYVIDGKKATLVGTATDDAGNPLENVVIRLSDPVTNILVALVTTNKKGRYAIYSKPGTYSIAVTKAGYMWKQASGNLGLEQIEIGKNQLEYPLSLSRITIES